MFAHARHIVVAQVFEFGIVAHSIIIGITIGFVSNSPQCTIEPLFAASLSISSSKDLLWEDALIWLGSGMRLLCSWASALQSPLHWALRLGWEAPHPTTRADQLLLILYQLASLYTWPW